MRNARTHDRCVRIPQLLLRVFSNTRIYLTPCVGWSRTDRTLFTCHRGRITACLLSICGCLPLLFNVPYFIFSRMSKNTYSLFFHLWSCLEVGKLWGLKQQKPQNILEWK